MDSYLVHVEVKSQELDEILQDLDQARDLLMKIYGKIGSIGTLVVEKEETASDN